MNAQTLDSRLDAVESRFALERLIAEYAQAFDSHDEALLRSIWHEGAKLSLGDAFGNFEGVEAIL
ncbi:nuclear transport factor 2 family protein, partial [Paraburkholderia metrosideri]